MVQIQKPKSDKIPKAYRGSFLKNQAMKGKGNEQHKYTRRKNDPKIPKSSKSDTAAAGRCNP